MSEWVPGDPVYPPEGDPNGWCSNVWCGASWFSPGEKITECPECGAPPVERSA